MIPGEDTSQVVHPPHWTFTWSSAFVPFCAYKTNLNISRSRLAIPGISFPLCSSFLPTILEGQLCYKLTLNTTSGQGKRNELMLLLDYNEERSLQTPAEEDKEEEFIALDPVDNSTELETLDPEGRYSLPAPPELFDEVNILQEALDNINTNVTDTSEN